MRRGFPKPCSADPFDASDAPAALKSEKVELRRRARKPGQERMNLSPVMRLMVEPMGERGGNLLLEFRRRRDRPIAHLARKIRFLETVDEGDDAKVLRDPHRFEIGEILEEDRVEPVGRIAAPREPFQPDAVGDEQMVERALDGFEEGAAIGAVIRIGKIRRMLIEPRIGPLIIGGEHLPMGFHRLA